LDGATAWFTPEIRDLGAAETAVVSTAYRRNSLIRRDF
jgi:hypothetical protein